MIAVAEHRELSSNSLVSITSSSESLAHPCSHELTDDRSNGKDYVEKGPHCILKKSKINLFHVRLNSVQEYHALNSLFSYGIRTRTSSDITTPNRSVTVTLMKASM